MTEQAVRTVIMVSGSGTNLQAIIDAAVPEIDIVAVVSDNPGAYGLQRAQDAGIAGVTVDYKSYENRADFDQALLETIQQIDPELIVLAGFMRILDDALVNAYTGRMLNIHPSLLPDYPGLNTYQRALDAGESHHGTTVHFVIPELDAGPAVLQYRVAITPDDTAETLAARVQQGEYQIYPLAIARVASGQLQMRDGVVLCNDEPMVQPDVIDESNASPAA